LAKSVVLPDVHVEDDDDDDDGGQHNYRAAIAATPQLYNKPPVATMAGTPVPAAAGINVVAPSLSDASIPRLYNRDDNMDRSATTTRPNANFSAANPPLASSPTRKDNALAISRLYNRTNPEHIPPRANASTVATRSLVVEQQQRLGTTTTSLAPPQQNHVSTDGRVVPDTAGLVFADSNSNNSADVEEVWGDDDDLSLDNNDADDEIAQPDTTTGVVAMDDDDDDFSPLAAPIGIMRHTTTGTIVNRKRWVNPRLHARRSLLLVSK
jgi:hypothetical protein